MESGNIWELVYKCAQQMTQRSDVPFSRTQLVHCVQPIPRICRSLG